ncbi:hypothetical protein LQW54_006826 [Pestalotiopsis sp. IQ-011]
MSERIRSKRQLLNMELDVASMNAYLIQALIKLGRDHHSTIDFHQLSDGDYRLPRRFSEHLVSVMASLAKKRNFDTSQTVGGEAMLVHQMTPYVAACIVAQIGDQASEDEAQKRKNDLVEEARRGLERFRARFWRCEAKDASGQRRCRNYWESHEKGHQFDDPSLDSHRYSGVTLSVGMFESSYDPDTFSEQLWKEVTLLRGRRHAVEKLALEAVSCGVASITGQRTCLAGGIRGIAELMILSEIERQVGLGVRIQELFDLVIGTSTGQYGL